MLILLFKTHTVYWLSQRLLLISLPSFLQVFYLWYLLYLLIHILFFLGMRGQREEGERGGSTLPLGKTPEAPVLVSNWWTEKMWGICGEKSTFSPRFINTLATKCPPQHFIKKFPIKNLQIVNMPTYSLHFTHDQINILSIGPHVINRMSSAQLASCQKLSVDNMVAY